MAKQPVTDQAQEPDKFDYDTLIKQVVESYWHCFHYGHSWSRGSWYHHPRCLRCGAVMKSWR